MLTDKQSLILCGILGIAIFSTGVLDILDNFITKTILTILFLVIVANLIISNSIKKESKE
ncbi:MAG: hypothetical protein GW839_06580 [Flavobacteriales bacterium]|nr:hypothetical protein [Flavobacteriia bacterium]NCP06441.1 hypothetical protein [Flavobacteriales bacterium]PIV92493.1 MAG: hypothetical protein COW44_14495 [Flavobacteriaceae bacterium CG17_big_fil_post_rev_8_21_14_2_50_33_15]PIY13383.1 MAG: hypothetical protein COZ17_00690 [Flavobacteriaceae bacterium CG_4_10_14_3_um_filter_33_47]PJB19710.1 MAG: hypothetical protein CO117_03535 [Flavobacteriaceae bacterium CG_4_9_14_3_um_filter_33_16]